ncbi:MAG: peptidoglycan-binding domain-containing protein [Actinomycetota bacterium]
MSDAFASCPGVGATPLRKGSAGIVVGELQAFRRLQGYSVGPIDGKLGNLTCHAVRTSQDARHLVVDEVAGTATRAAIRTMAQQAGFASLADRGGKVRRPGANLPEVQESQRRPKAAGHPPGPIDGKYGARTTAAVRAFQQAHSPPAVDGKVGAGHPGRAGLGPRAHPARDLLHQTAGSAQRRDAARRSLPPTTAGRMGWSPLPSTTATMPPAWPIWSAPGRSTRSSSSRRPPGVSRP